MNFFSSRLVQCAVIIMVISLVSACDRSDRTSYQGYVEGENVYLASPYSGVLVKKLIERGQTVKQGLVLFRLDENPEVLMVQEHEAELAQAKKVLADLQQPRRPAEIKAIQEQIEQTDAQLKLAELRMKRFQQLKAKGATDQDTLDSAVAHFKELENVKAQYQANLDLANQGSRSQQIEAQQSAVDALNKLVEQNKWQLAQKTIIAPSDGVIFDTYYQEGEFVPASRAIASLLPTHALRVEFFVPARVMNRLQVGQKVRFSCHNCSKTELATINYISPEAEYIPPLVYSDANIDKLVFRIKALIETPSLYKPGQPVMVVVLYGEK